MFYISNKNHVPALERAYNIMVALTASPRPLGISELARLASLSKSTVHGLVHTLESLGFISKEEAGRGFSPSLPLMDIWRQTLLNGRFKKAAAPFLAEFSAQNEVTVMAGVFLHSHVLVVDAAQAPGLGVSAYQGQLVPVWAGALGKILLAYLPPDFGGALLDEFVSQSPLNRKEYLEEVEAARKTGIAADRDEYLRGITALAGFIPPAHPLEPLGAIWAVGLTPSLDGGRLIQLAPKLKDICTGAAGAMSELDI